MTFWFIKTLIGKLEKSVLRQELWQSLIALFEVEKSIQKLDHLAVHSYWEKNYSIFIRLTLIIYISLTLSEAVVDL